MAATATKTQRYRALGIALCIVGGVLVVLALVQDLFGVRIFDESPWLVGSAVGFIGALLAAGTRRGAADGPHSRGSPRP